MQNKLRLRSLDFFRGITVAAMILVNNAGDWGHVYAPLEHSAWNGCTPTDLIFPFFVFIIGVSISFALKNYRANSDLHAEASKKALARALKIFGLGLFLAWFGPNLFKLEGLTQLRIPGVLQRIAMVYLLAVLVFLKLGNKGIATTAIMLLLGYWALMTLVPVPGLGQASFDPETNLGAWVDRSVFGTAHLYKHSVTWDPEGLLGTIPSLATALLGLLTGRLLLNAQLASSKKLYVMLASGFALVLLGLLWGTVFPINKSLWTSSYVLYSAGWALLGFGFCYWMLDIKGYKRFTIPFVAYGCNAIAIYVASGIMGILFYWISWGQEGQIVTLKGWLMDNFYQVILSPYNASVAYAVTYVFVFYLMAIWLYKKQLFIKV